MFSGSIWTDKDAKSAESLSEKLFSSICIFVAEVRLESHFSWLRRIERDTCEGFCWANVNASRAVSASSGERSSRFQWCVGQHCRQSYSWAMLWCDEEAAFADPS